MTPASVGVALFPLPPARLMDARESATTPSPVEQLIFPILTLETEIALRCPVLLPWVTAAKLTNVLWEMGSLVFLTIQMQTVL